MSYPSLFAKTVRSIITAAVVVGGWLVLPGLTPHVDAQLIDALQSNDPQKDRARAKREFVGSAELALSPAPLPAPALKYQLLPPPEKLTARNAAPCYTRAILLNQNLGSEHFKTYVDNFEEWGKWPMSEQTRDQAAKWVHAAASAYDETRRGAFSAHCDWDLRLHEMEGPEILLIRLQEFQDARSLARLIAVKAHVEISQGQLDQALETLQVGFKLAHDVGEAPLVICNLVGIAIAQMMCHETELFCQAEGAPNLYWAVTDIPQPLIDVQPGLRVERMMPRKVFPFLADAESVERTDQQWRAVLQDALHRIDVVTFGSLQEDKDLEKVLQEGSPKAKQGLADFGYSDNEIAAMSSAEAVGIYTARLVNHVYDETFKWNSLPYLEAEAGMKKTIEELTAAGYLSGDGSKSIEQREVLPICSTLIPSIQGVHWASVRCQRRFATLRVLEAIRAHAAAHNGQLPASLDEIEVAPVPHNPFTGRPFLYERQGDTVVLTADSPAGFAPDAFSRQYKISLRK